MNPNDFAQTYLRYEADITRILQNRRIFDRDRLHDTYIALYEHTPHPMPDEFVTTFVTFYTNLSRWQNNGDSAVLRCNNTQLAALDIIDETDWPQREQSLQRLEPVLRYYYTHPQPNERDHKRACCILRLFLKGLSEREISRRLNISQQAVNQSLQRIKERLKVVGDILYNREAPLTLSPPHPLTL